MEHMEFPKPYVRRKLDISQRHPEDEPFVHSLRVTEGMTSDAGRTVTRVDGSSMILLGIKPSHVLVMRGKNGRRLAAHCLDSFLLEMEPVIRMDAVMRYNLGLNIGDLFRSDSIVDVIRDPQDCARVSLEPISSGTPSAIDNEYISRALQGATLVPSQVIMVPYFGGRWYPYAVIGTYDEDDFRSDTATVIGPE